MTDNPHAIHVALARIEERQVSNSQRVSNIDTKIDALANRLDRYAEKDDLVPIEKRIASVEGTQAWFVRSAVGVSGIVVAGLYAVGKKFGIGS